MAFQNSNPFYGGSGGGIPASGNQQRLALDNLIRRELKVGDPNDPKQIAEALLNRFKDDPRANAITQEAKGLPFLAASPLQTPMAPTATSCETELKQAMDDVDSDLRELTTNTLLKDSASELRGWTQAIRALITEGTAAARFALDTRQRDKVFAIRRQLGDYARLARMIGALTPNLSPTFRSFAKSLDEVASVFLVMMGEALANVGFTGGRFLLQVPYTELQVRREAAIAALRNLTGSTEVSSLYQNDYQRGLNAYRKLYKFLDDQGQGDLRVLLLENELARAMDEIIQRAAHGTVDGLRALGATVEVDLDRFRRLIAVGNQLEVDSPPLAAFLDALLLFVQSFDAAGGFRLLRIARPPILFYGLYGTGFASMAEKRLLDLITSRGLLADQADCYLQCGCAEGAVRCQILLDKMLYDVDRAIDLYAVGEAEWGEPEIRAAAYGYLAKSLITVKKDGNGCITEGSDIEIRLNDIVSKLIPDKSSPDWPSTLELSDTEPLQNSDVLALMKSELCNQFNREIQDTNGRGLRRIVETIAPNCIGLDVIYDELRKLMDEGIRMIDTNFVTCPPLGVNLPITEALSAQGLNLAEYVSLQPDQQALYNDFKFNPHTVLTGLGLNWHLKSTTPQGFTGLRQSGSPIFNPSLKLASTSQTNGEMGGIDLKIKDINRIEGLRLLQQIMDAAQGDDLDRLNRSTNQFYDFILDNESFNELNLDSNLENMAKVVTGKLDTKLNQEDLQNLKRMCLELAGAIGLNIPN